jgi:hypothetical protein
MLRGFNGAAAKDGSVDPSPKTSVTRTCLLCSKEAANKCGRCKTVWYCGTECQKADWKHHKVLCQPNADGKVVYTTTATLRPGHGRVIHAMLDSAKYILACHFGEDKGMPMEDFMRLRLGTRAAPRQRSGAS